MANDTFHVTSSNQQGGITAGVINVSSRSKIPFTDENKKFILETFLDKNITVHVSLQNGGSSELIQLAQDIKSFLIDAGYKNVLGVHTVLGFTPFKGVSVEKKSETESVIFIGSLL